ncbi:MAG: hypothetical protein IPK80_30325 [Nannocystis sp.]|nr:hypothetical protein [Nannocystis sp.]
MIAAIRPLTPPASLKATCSKDALGQLRALLDEIRAWASGLVGLGSIEADALYNGDPMAVLLRDELIAWALAHARTRLEKPNPRDQDDPFRKWIRLNVEICGWLEELCLEQGPRVALEDVPDRIAAEIWDATVGAELRIQSDEGGMRVDFGRMDPIWHEAIRQTLMLYAWNEADALPRAREQFPSRTQGDPDDLTQRRRALAEDIVEARALIIAGYDAASIACPQTGGWTTFEWDLRHSTGLILVAPTREQLIDQDDKGLLQRPLRVLPDGRIAGYVRWWEPADDPAWEVALLEPLHARIVEAWLARAPSRPPEEEPSTAVAAVAAVADACQHIAETIEGHRIPAVRMQTLLRLLERRLGCEVASGKGSEVTVYRPGARKFTLGHHTRNTHVPAHVVRALLKAVGISVAEWWRTCAG